MRAVRILIAAATLAAVAFQPLPAQGNRFSFSVKGSLTTGSQLFPNPNSPDEVQRAAFFSVDNIFGYGVEVRYRFPETDLAIGISADYLRKTEPTAIRVSSGVIPVEDGYRVVPLEVTGYFIIPISGERFGVYMGGGAGTYVGRRIYRVGDVEAETIDQGSGFGIHVLSGLTYNVTPSFAVLAEMKFRDLQFNSVNRFTRPQIQYGNTFVNVGTEPFESRVHTDGVVFQLGAMYSF